MKKNTKEAHQKYFLINGQILDTTKFNPSDITKTTTVYEVIRVIDGIALFAEEHLQRLNKSLVLLGHEPKLNEKMILQEIYKLIKINQCNNYNLKVIANKLEDPQPNIFIFFIESNYPDKAYYTSGIHTILYSAERDNPNAKVILKNFRDKIDEAIKSAGAYEALLLNKEGEITEGSRSNIFLVKDHVLYTAPADKVLKGITRTRIIDLSKTLNISFEEKPISVDFLKSADGLFMTGTSPKVLPIASVDDILYDSTSNPIVLKLQDAYDQLIGHYIGSKKEN